MPKASEVAAELRKFADSLDRNPDAEIAVPAIYSHHWYKDSKQAFMNLARLMPRPLVKSLSYGDKPDRVLTYESPALRIVASIPQSLTCELIAPATPAVYRCDPILSESEDAELESA